MVSKDSEVEQCKKQPLQQPQAVFSSSSHQSAQCGSMVCTQEQEWQGRWPILPPHPKEFPAQPRSCTALQGRGDLQTEGEISLATPHARPLTALAHPQLPSHRAIQGQHPMPNPTLAALQGLPFPRHEAVLGQSSPLPGMANLCGGGHSHRDMSNVQETMSDLLCSSLPRDFHFSGWLGRSSSC